jgi:hypothetical protein
MCTKIEAIGIKPGMLPWPPISGLRNALTATLAYFRRNRVQGGDNRETGARKPTKPR